MSSDAPTPLVAVLRHNFKQKFPAWRVQGDAADEIERLTRELAEARKELAEYRAATDPHYVDELAALKAENARLAKALEEVLPRLLELKLFQSAHICQQALAARGRENEQANRKHEERANG